jgi:Protein of unknown function (DUF4230)
MAARSKSHPIRTTIATLVVLVAAIVTAGVVAVTAFKHPIRTVTVDRTPPVVLTKLQDLAEYRAASGSFEVLVDVEKDVKYVPKAIAGERTFFVGIGTVDAVVDFSKLDDSHVVAAPDRTSATIVLPRAQLKPANVDPAQSHVVARDRGLFNRVSGVFNDSPTSEQELYVSAAAKMSEAANATGLGAKAEENTRTMLTSLLTQLGFTHIIVIFDGPVDAA